MSFWRIEEGDALERLRLLPDGLAQCCVTSPPYFGLRDYGVEGQVGLESTPDKYVARLVEVFREARRVLRDDGLLWVVIGDSYAGSWGNQGRKAERGTQRPIRGEMLTPVLDGRYPDKGTKTGAIPDDASYKPKDLLGIPWMLAFALRAEGWFLRSDVIWTKPNPMPSSVRDRCTSSHEHVFMLSKRARYFYDTEAVSEPAVSSVDYQRRSNPGANGRGSQAWTEGSNGDSPQQDHSGWIGGDGRRRNKRDVWTVATQPFPEAHFAVFPPKLVVPMILASTSPQACAECGAPWKRVTRREDQGFDGSRYGERAVDASGGAITGGTVRSTLGSSGGKLTGQQQTVGWEPICEHDDGDDRCVVLDPFCGAGTVGLVALGHERDFIGIDLNSEYVEMARKRILAAELDGAEPWPLSVEAERVGASVIC